MLPRHTGVHIDMTPMVDVMMLLVIFFMMSTVFIVDDMGFAVNLPQASTAKAVTDAVSVAVDKDGKIGVNGQLVAKAELAAKIGGMAAANQGMVVSLKADKEASHGQVVEVMDVIRRAGIAKISIAVEEPGR